MTVRRKSGNAVDAVLADPAAFSAEVLLAVLQSPASKPPELKRKGSPTELTGLRRRAWAPVGQEAHVMREATRSQNLALIVVLGLVPGNKHGVIASHWKPGRYPRTALVSFLEEDYLPAMAAFRKKPPAHERDRKGSLNMDNCRTHVSQDVQDAVAHAGVEIVDIPSSLASEQPVRADVFRDRTGRAHLYRGSSASGGVSTAKATCAGSTSARSSARRPSTAASRTFPPSRRISDRVGRRGQPL